ncbi:MAG: C-terminal binding protein [Pirellulales bacterium]
MGLKVLITDYAWPDLDIERAILAEVGAEVILPEDQDAASLARAAVEADAIMTNWANVPAQVIAAAAGCRIVARLGVGLDNIDVAFATERGIVVTNVPDYCRTEVAEHALALILALARKVAYYHAQTKSGVYNLKAGPALRRIEGQTLGIVGLGSIGRSLAEKAVGIGLCVAAFSRSGRQSPGVRLVSLDELLTHSDYVSLHVPLSDQTRHLIGAEQLRRMKPSAYLINTARGDVVDHSALAEALDQNQLAGAALDVQSPEPPDLSQPPYNDPRVIVTPHAAFVSVESLENLRSRASRQVATRLAGGVPEAVVNPRVLQ